MAKTTHASKGEFASRGAVVLAWVAAACWAWALALLATRHVHILDYQVIAASPAAWGFLGLPIVDLILIAALGALLGAGCVRAAAHDKRICPAPCGWLLATLLIGGLDLLRLGAVEIPYTFGEPLYFVFVTGCAVAALVRRLPSVADRLHRVSDRVWLGATWLATAMAASWWYWQGKQAYGNFFLGFHDAGHFARRVVNTWEGRGFLMETPSLPPFWDHFNPGLALVAPLWGLWPNALLFVLIQALCLALPAPMIFVIARRHGADAATSAMWAAAYLLFPAVGQLNLNYSYGWHPISLALPLLVASILLLLQRRIVTAMGVGLLACMFEEAVIVVAGCLAAALAWQSWRAKTASADVNRDDQSIAKLASSMPWTRWLAVWGLLTIGFLLVYLFAGFAEFQSGRVELKLSSAFQIQSLWFILAMLVPLGFVSPLKGWPILLTIALPVSVLLLWTYQHTTSIAFQYVTTLIPLLFTASIAATARCRRTGPLSSASAALAAGFVATLLFGAMPCSRPTLDVLASNMYPGETRGQVFEQRQPGSEGIRELAVVVALVNDPEASVLATGNIALHLLSVERLEPVNEAAEGSRHQALAAEAGPGRSWVDLFDWIVLDTREHFQQSPELIDKTRTEALRRGFQIVRNNFGVIVLRRNDVARPLLRS